MSITRKKFLKTSLLASAGVLAGSRMAFSQGAGPGGDLAMSWSEWGKLDATAIGFPAISLPTGLLNSGLPCGSQLQGRWGDDGRIMQVAAQIERAKPEWFGMTPPVHVSNA
jgi:Asp-tRNA(Asn)/Glu-tRNA(Gln) amidotransferase A subunit family amidase